MRRTGSKAPGLATHAGSAVLGWPTSDGLVASRYLNGTWGEPVALALEMGEVFDQPRAAHLDGGFVIVWRSDQSFMLPGPKAPSSKRRTSTRLPSAEARTRYQLTGAHELVFCHESVRLRALARGSLAGGVELAAAA